MSFRTPPPDQDSQRQALVYDAIVGFVSFFALLAVIQAVLNVLQPEPAVWPAVLALVLVVLSVILWRKRGSDRRAYRKDGYEKGVDGKDASREEV